MSSIRIWRDRFLFTSPRLVRSASTRPSVVLLVAPRGELALTISGSVQVGQAFIVNANVRRALEAATGLYSLHLDPADRIGKYLRTVLLDNREFLDLSSLVPPQLFASAFEATFGVDQPCNHAYEQSQRMLDMVLPRTGLLTPLDPRVSLVADWLWVHLPPRVELSVLTELSGLSASRLAHLFTYEVGISLRQYLLWVKMRKAAQLFVEKRSLIDVAHSIGFADSAHLSRTFQRFFSWKPSDLSNPKLVSVRICSA